MGTIEEYRQLVIDRKSCRRCTDLINPACVESGKWDSEHVGPWTAWQGNPEARLMIIGQDWGDEGYFRANLGLEKDGNPTNGMLVKLLASIGIAIHPPSARSGHGEVFLTNSILCLKQGGLQGPVSRQWFDNCRSFLRRQIEIVAPAAVVTLGSRALHAVRAEFGLPKRTLRRSVEDQEGEMLNTVSHLFAMYHCGARVMNTHRKREQQFTDWVRLRRVLDRESLHR